MHIRDVIWTEGSVEHIARHGVGIDEVEWVAFSRTHVAAHVSGRRYLLTGQTGGGRYLTVIVDKSDCGAVVVVTARNASQRERLRFARRRQR